MKLEWAREEYSLLYKKRSGLAWFKTGIWKLRGVWKGFEKGRCPLCRGEKDALYILLKYSETRKWGGTIF
jgi:hypothetical protein